MTKLNKKKNITKMKAATTKRMKTQKERKRKS